MKKMTTTEMDGFLKGKCIPRDLKVNETNAEYLVRKFGELESKLETALRECRSAGVTIDNLEAKCAALSVQVELSIAAERAWERSMMYACGEDGPKSVADKFADLEAKCAALAAENEEMKSGILQASENMEAHHDDHGLFSYDADGEQMDALLRLCDAQESIALLENVKTPATDAFLAEVRAQGVEMFSDILKVAGICEHPYLDAAIDLAAKLRQDTNSARLQRDEPSIDKTNQQFESLSRGDK